MTKYELHNPYGGSRDNHPKVIVIHAMAEYIKDGKKTYHAAEFLNEYELSAHALGAPNGDLYRLRNDNQTAWHARGFNQDSLGYEFLVPGEHDYASFLEALKENYVLPLQYETGLNVLGEWKEKHNIDTIVKHSDLSPGRKVDPGMGFPWDDLMRDLGMR